MSRLRVVPKRRTRSTYFKQKPELVRSLIARAAHLFYRSRMSQRDIATLLTKDLREHLRREGKRDGNTRKVTQTQVSRLLARAHEQKIVTVEVNAFYREDLEEQLLPLLTPHAIRRVRVVGGGEGKNTHQLGIAGAEVALECIQDIEREYIRLTLSCGETLQEVARWLVENIRRLDAHDRSATRNILCYPYTLHADYHVKAIYPTTLVTGLAAVTGLRSYAIQAYAASLPEGFYQRRKADRRKSDAYLKEGRIQELLVDPASQADVFLLGIGTNDTYQDFIARFPVDDKARDAYVAELGFTGIAEDGSWDKEVADLLVGVSATSMASASADTKRYSIAVAGGDRKKEAVAAAIKTKCFNVLVTDETVAYGLLGRTLS
jgi:DNA-binding transcriptional regulator LsrR (DeoR family)